ncbi:radial spoke head 10-like B, partial [Silurus asotus]
MHGHGEYEWADGVKYEGDFKSNAPMGHGTYTWLDSSTYEGEVCNGICHGTGTYKSAKTRTIYKGQWHKGKRHGKGTMWFNQEATSWYKGDWKNNHREGWGIRRYPSGDIYEGQWKNSMRHEEGTMKWIQLAQQYSGQWLNGVQHGQGTHTIFQWRLSGSRYPCNNEYTGGFAYGLRHGYGTFAYANGAVYSGGWKNNIKHGQAKFISRIGWLYEGMFINDRVPEIPSSVFALGGFNCTTESSGIKLALCAPDLAMNIETLLNQIPESQREEECRQVEFAVSRNSELLRLIYRLYSSLGHEDSSVNNYLLSHLQLWRFLKDCNIHQHGLTLAQLDHLITKDVFPGEVISPFSTMLPRQWISYIAIAAYHIYHRDFESGIYVLEECFSKLLEKNIIPNAKNVKGPLYCHPLHAVVGMSYTDRCWEIYKTVPKVNLDATSDIIMTARHFFWMFKVLGLFDCTLTTTKLLEILSQENPAIYNSTHINLELEITFLEFFEALLACAEVKNTQGIGTAQCKQCEEFKSKATTQSSQTEELKGIYSKYKQYFCDQSTVYKHRHNPVSLVGMHSRLDCQLISHHLPFTVVMYHWLDFAEDSRPEESLEDWINRIHCFFIHIFFPAYEHTLIWKKKIQEERQRKTTDNKITLENAKANAKLREQQRAEEELSKEKIEEVEDRSHVLDEQSSSPVSPSSSVDLKQSPTSKKKTKRK